MCVHGINYLGRVIYHRVKNALDKSSPPKHLIIIVAQILTIGGDQNRIMTFSLGPGGNLW